jgi:hypothetical protein
MSPAEYSSVPSSVLHSPLPSRTTITSLSLMKMPRNCHCWTQDVLMNVRLCAKLFVRNEITNPCPWAARNFTQPFTENCHAHSPQ